MFINTHYMALMQFFADRMVSLNEVYHFLFGDSIDDFVKCHFISPSFMIALNAGGIKLEQMKELLYYLKKTRRNYGVDFVKPFICGNECDVYDL